MEKIKVERYDRKNGKVIPKKSEINNNTNKVISTFIIKLLINTIVLLLASKLFSSFHISGFFVAFIGALLINILNCFLKPLLIRLTLPITLMSMGLLYPIVNVIILKITSLLIGSNFQINGLLIPFIISIFISFMNMLLESIILKEHI